jgi:small subunit ribosomal protein S8
MVADPVSDLVTQINNASRAKKALVSIPYSALKLAIALKLAEAGFVKTAVKHGKKARKNLDIELLYDKEGTPRIEKMKRVSTPGKRVYTKAANVHKVRGGKGALFLSTPKGIMTGAEAHKASVGGEALFTVW